ncbi:MAG: diadenylate cyclase CdaA [Tepidisphaeraceae bacterium]
MLALFENFNNFFKGLSGYPWYQVTIELMLIGVCVYGVLRFLQGTRGARLLRGIAFLLVALYIIVELLGNVLNLDRIRFLYGTMLSGVWFAVAVAFQPELRRALMRLGETRLFKGMGEQAVEQIDVLVDSAMYCSRRKVGALVAIERDVGLGGVAENGTHLDAEITAELLNTIFWPGSPLHDLGVVVSNNRVAYAGVQFPLAESDELEKELGSRHRAAVGLSQEADAVVLVVSEETGGISIAERGVLYRKLTPEGLRAVLKETLTYGRPVTPQVIEKVSPQTTIVRAGKSESVASLVGSGESADAAVVNAVSAEGEDK